MKRRRYHYEVHRLGMEEQIPSCVRADRATTGSAASGT